MPIGVTKNLQPSRPLAFHDDQRLLRHRLPRGRFFLLANTAGPQSWIEGYLLVLILLVSSFETYGEPFLLSTPFQLFADMRHQLPRCHTPNDEERCYIQTEFVGASADFGAYGVVSQKTVAADVQVERFAEFLADCRSAELEDALDLDDSLDV